jgi:hypothetical protein
MSYIPASVCPSRLIDTVRAAVPSLLQPRPHPSAGKTHRRGRRWPDPGGDAASAAIQRAGTSSAGWVPPLPLAGDALPRWPLWPAPLPFRIINEGSLARHWCISRSLAASRGYSVSTGPCQWPRKSETAHSYPRSTLLQWTVRLVVRGKYNGGEWRERVQRDAQTDRRRPTSPDDTAARRGSCRRSSTVDTSDPPARQEPQRDDWPAISHTCKSSYPPPPPAPPRQCHSSHLYLQSNQDPTADANKDYNALRAQHAAKRTLPSPDPWQRTLPHSPRACTAVQSDHSALPSPDHPPAPVPDVSTANPRQSAQVSPECEDTHLTTRLRRQG